MGCIGSVPMVENTEPIQRLPVKPHLRQTFGQANLQGNGMYEPGQPTATVRQVTVEHDLVILHSSTGSSHCTSLAHALSTPPHSLSVWLPTDQQKPTASTNFARHSTAGEIAPCSTNNVSRTLHSITALELNPTQVATAVSHSGCGTVVLVTAGSTWDEGLLACMRQSALKERPLVLVHAPESCPAPNMSDWPLDVQQLLTNRGTPMLTCISSYTEHAAQQVVDALREQLQNSPQKQLRQSITPQSGLSSSFKPDVYHPASSGTPKQACSTPVTAGNGPMVGQCTARDSKQLPSSSPAGMTTSSSANLTSGSSGWQSSQPDSSATATAPNSSEEASPHGNGHADANMNGSFDTNAKLQKPWQITLQRLSQKPGISQGEQEKASSDESTSQEESKAGLMAKQSPQQHAATTAVVNAQQGNDKAVVSSTWAAHHDSGSQQYDVVLAAHHHSIGAAVCQVAAALAPFQRVLVVDGIGCLTRRQNHLGRVSTQGQLGEMFSLTHPQRNGKQPHKPLFSINSLTEDPNADNNSASQPADNIVNHDASPESKLSVCGITPELQLNAIANSVLALDGAIDNANDANVKILEHSQSGLASSIEFPPGGLAPIMALLPCMHLPSSAAGLASQLLEPSGNINGMVASNSMPHRSHHARSISVGTGLNFSSFKSPWHQQGCYSQQPSQAEEAEQQGYHIVSSVSAEARAALAGGCRHYVLFPGLNLGTASALAVNEVQAALQGGAMMHVVCEASFNLIPPDVQQWPLCHVHLKQLLQAWDARLLYYHDHLDPLLEKLAERISAAATTNQATSNTAPSDATRFKSISAQSDNPGPASSLGSAFQNGDASQHDKLQRLTPEMKHAVGGVTALIRAASDVSGIPGVADLCLQLTARPSVKQFAPTPTPLSVV